MTVVKANDSAAPDELARATGVRLRQVARLHEQLQRRNADGCGVASLPQCHVLTALGREGPLTLAALARRLELDKGWVSRTVDALSQGGLVDKRPGEPDRRSVTLRLTPEGETQYRALDARLTAQSGRVLRHVPEAERASVRRALDLLALALAAELDAAPAPPGGD